MASRKLLRDFLISKQPLYRQLLTSSQDSISTSRIRLLAPHSYSGNRQLSFFENLSEQAREEAKRNPEFEQSVKEMKKKAEELKGVTEDLKVRTKQTTEQLYKHVDGVWTEAKATAKKVRLKMSLCVLASSNLKEKVSVAVEEVKETFGIGRQESPESSGTSANFGSGGKDGNKSACGEDKQHQSGPSDTAKILFSKFRSSVSYISPKFSSAFQKVKDTKLIDLAKKGYNIVKEELRGNPTKRKRLEYTAPSTNCSEKFDRSTSTDIVVLPSKQSRWSKKWEAFKQKMQGHPVFKRVGGLSEPVVTKTQELAEDVREMWEVSDNPVVHKIQDLNESVFGETAAGISVKEIRRRDPSFSLPEFRDEVQEVVRPVLTAYYKGDAEFLKKYCSSEIIERCKAEHKALESQNIFIDNKFQTQEVYCVRDKLGSITEGGKDTILTVYYGWAMQRVDEEELEEGALFPIWKLREMQKSGVQALI